MRYILHYRTILKELRLLGTLPRREDQPPSKEKNPTILYQDNEATINSFIGIRKFRENQSPLIDGYIHYVREQIEYNHVTIEYIGTKDQRADIFTKPLPVLEHNRFLKQLSILPNPLLDKDKKNIIEIGNSNKRKQEQPLEKVPKRRKTVTQNRGSVGKQGSMTQ